MTSKHTHKLKKHRYKNGTTIFHCILPDCYFRVDAALALGKEVLCSLCDEKFIMNEYTIKLARPHCSNCGRKEVKIDGKKHYVNKRSGGVLTAVADNDLNDLRSRLDSVTKIDEDI